jgi:hypothetical protein
MYRGRPRAHDSTHLHVSLCFRPVLLLYTGCRGQGWAEPRSKPVARSTRAQAVQDTGARAGHPTEPCRSRGSKAVSQMGWASTEEGRRGSSCKVSDRASVPLDES